MKIRILDCCTICEFCVDACPDVFAMCNGRVIVLAESIQPEMNDLINEIVEECPVNAIVEGSAIMEKEYILGLGHACSLWFRSDLEHIPESTIRVAEVLREAGIEVRKVHGGWLECEPRPAGISEALSGQLAEPQWLKQCNCPPEEPGRVLKLLADKGIQVTGER